MAGARTLASRLLTALSFVLVAGGVCALAYPAVSNLLAEREQAAVAGVYEASSTALSPEVLASCWDAARLYNEQLAGDPVHDPFVPGSGYALPGNYGNVLDPSGDGCMAVLEIPSIDVRLPIYHGTSEEVLRKGAGHMEQTALPIGTTGGRPVITGHRGLPEAELFTRLDELGEGDLFCIHVLDATLWYEVVGTEVIEPDALESLTAVPSKDLVTLLTCTPYGVNTHRLLVTGERCEAPEEGSGPSASSVATGIPWYGYAAGIAIAAAAGAVLYVIRTRRAHTAP